MQTTPILVFADEAGNTGTNFLDDEQRWYVLAGIAIESDRVEAARTDLATLLHERGGSELKGSRLLATSSGRELVRELFRVVGKHGVPFFAVLEKRFNLGGRFDHIVSDPKANARFSWSEHFDPEARRAAAAAIAKLPQETLLRIQAALRDARGTEWPVLISECAANLRSLGELQLADQVEGAKSASFKDLFGDAEFTAKDLTVNEAAFTTLLQLIDQTAIGAGTGSIEVVHDATTSFEATFKEVHERLRAKHDTSGVILDAQGNKVWPLVAIQDLTFAVSHDELLVQAADVIAATMAWICRITQPEEYSGEPSAREIAELISGMWLSTNPRLIHALVSDDELSNIGRTLRILRSGQTASASPQADDLVGG